MVQLPPDAQKTSVFFKQSNDLFDILNSNNPNTFVHKQAITRYNLDAKLQELDKSIEWIGSWTFNNGKVIKKSMPFQKGLIITLKGVKQVIIQCFQLDFKFLCTRRLNQDPLEVS